MDRDKGHIYDIKNGVVDTTKAIFHVKGEKVFQTEHHPGGASPHAMFTIKGDTLHTTENHPYHSHILELKKSL